VLLASTPQGRRRPRLADALDLIAGGLRARLRPHRAGMPDASWPDALAACSVALPVLVLTALAVVYAWNLAAGSTLAGLSDFYLPSLALALPPVLALRYRRAAVLTAIAGAAWFWFLLLRTLTVWIDGLEASYCLALLVQVTALAGSPGPRRAAEVLSWRTWLVLCASGIAMGFASLRFDWALLTWQAAAVIVAFLAAVAVGLLVTLPKPAASRLLLVLAIPACSGAVFAIQFASASDGGVAPPPFLEVASLPVLLAFFAAAGWWARQRGHRGV